MRREEQAYPGWLAPSPPLRAGENVKIEVRSSQLGQNWVYLNDREAFVPDVWEFQYAEDKKSAKGDDLLVLHLFDQDTERKLVVCMFPKYAKRLAEEWGEDTSMWLPGGSIGFVWLGTRMNPIPMKTVVKVEDV